MNPEVGAGEVFLGAGHFDAADDVRKAHAHVVLQHTGEIGLVVMKRLGKRAQANGAVVLLYILQYRAAIGTGRLVAPGAEDGRTLAGGAEHLRKKQLHPAHRAEIGQRRFGRALLNELLQGGERAARLKVRRHIQIIHFVRAVQRFAEENAHFIAARHQRAELRIKRGAAHMQRNNISVGRDGHNVRRARRNDHNAAESRGERRAVKKDLTYAFENNDHGEAVVFRGFRAEIGKKPRHGNVAPGRKNRVLRGEVRGAGGGGVLEKGRAVYRLGVDNGANLVKNLLGLRFRRGRRRRGRQKILLFYHLKRFSERRIRAGIAEICRKIFLQLLDRHLQGGLFHCQSSDRGKVAANILLHLFKYLSIILYMN